MPSSVLYAAVIVAWAAAAGLFAFYAIQTAGRITYVTLADGRKQERRLPLSFRILLPFTPNLENFARGASATRSRELADALLVTAGYEGLLSGWEFVALKFIRLFALGLPWCFFAHFATAANDSWRHAFPPICMMGLAMIYVMPGLWLKRVARERQAKILKAMPFVLDLLTLSVEAGLDFMSAMQRSAERPVIDPLSEELLRVTREIQVGSSRRKALRAMSDRVSLPDMRSLVNALTQADELGVSIGAILRIQSDQIRQRRFERAEKLANEAPVKLLGPLMVFIFPAVFLILLGPVIFRMMQQM
jgi:tight adherence protein C